MRISLIIAVALLAAVVHANTLVNGFVYDDHLQLLGNPQVVRPASVRAIFGSSVWGFRSTESTEFVSNYYRPLFILAYAGLYAVFGPSAAAFHAAFITIAPTRTCWNACRAGLLRVRSAGMCPGRAGMATRACSC